MSATALTGARSKQKCGALTGVIQTDYTPGGVSEGYKIEMSRGWRTVACQQSLEQSPGLVK